MTNKATPLARPDLPDYDDFETDLVAEHGKAWRTAATYADHARCYVDWLTVNAPDVAILDATPEHLRKYLRQLARTDRSTSYRRLAVFGARWLYSWLCRDDEDTKVNPAKKVKVPVQDKPTTAYYTPEQFRAMLLAARTAATGYQHRGLAKQARRAWFDLALLAVLRYTGLRLHELVGLRTADVNLDERRLRVRRGKGGKPRSVPIARPLAAILAHYLAEVRPHCPDSPYLFANPSGLKGKGMYGRTAERAIHQPPPATCTWTTPTLPTASTRSTPTTTSTALTPPTTDPQPEPHGRLNSAHLVTRGVGPAMYLHRGPGRCARRLQHPRYRDVMATTIDRAQLQARLDEFLARAAAGERILIRDSAGHVVALMSAEDARPDRLGPARRRRHHATRTIEEVLAEDRGA